MGNRIIGRVRIACAFSACMLPTQGFAQAQSDRTADDPVAAETPAQPEIVVTARRREENVQDVPATVQVIGADELIRRNILNEQDLQTAVPGLLVRTNNNQSQLNYVIRGETFEPYSGSVPGVQPYLNEVALSGNAAPPFYDLENVQVLKGPQGTLFGRNSTGGAVLYQTRRPGKDFGGFASLQHGRFDRLVAEGALDLPIASDVLNVRVAGTYQDGGSYVRNLYDNRLLGDFELKSGRITIDLRPSDAVRNTTLVQYAHYKSENIPKRVSYVAPCGVGSAQPCYIVAGGRFLQRLVNGTPGSIFPGYPAGTVYTGSLSTFIDYLDANGRYTVSANASGDNRAKDTVVVNTTTVDLSDDVAVKNIFGYSKTRRRGQTDNDNTPYPLLQTGGTTAGNPLEGRATRQVSDELQLQGKAFDGRLNYIVGAFYAGNRATFNSPVTGLVYTAALDLFTPFSLRYRARNTDDAYALFTQGTFALTDTLNLTGGIRQSWDKLSIIHLPGSTFAGTRRKSTNVDDLSWTVSLDYKAAPSLMLYATTRGSWRVGGYNPFVPPGTGSDTQTAETGGNYFPSETVRDIEVGFKFDDRVGGLPVRFNADFFYLWAKNIEKTGTTIISGRVTSATLSVPAGRTWGIEADTLIRPARWLSVGGNVTYNVGKFTDRDAVIFGQPVRYDTFPDTPKLSGTVYADATHSLGDAGELAFHVDLFGQTDFHLTSLGRSFNPGDKVPGYALVNGRVDWRDPLGAKGITASVFVRNITKGYYFTGGGGGVQANGTNSLNLGLPRTWGLQARAEF